MVQGIEQRVQELEAEVCALQQLLLAHIVAFAPVDGLATDATCDIAVSQLDAALDIQRVGSAKKLAGLLQAIQDCRN